MSFDISNPNIDPPEYARANRIFFMFLNVRRDNKRNWISNKFNALSTLGNQESESKGSFIKTVPSILSFLMAMGVNYSFELISIETYALQFIGPNKFFLGSVIGTYSKEIFGF